MPIGLRSRKHISPFELLRPDSLEALRQAVFFGRGRAAMMAGGLDLIDRLKGGEPVDRIIQLGGVGELCGIRRDGDAISIGALTTHAELACNPHLAELLPDLPALWRIIASPRVRHAGSIGGNLMSALPHYDAWPALLALGAEVVVVDRTGEPSTLDLPMLRGRDDLILMRVRIKVVPSRARGRRRLLAERSLHPAVSVYLGADIADDEVRAARISVGCAFSEAKVIPLALSGVPVARLATDAATLARTSAAALPEPIDDGLASTAYRRRMIEVLARRLLIRIGAQP
jgi:aerobic carbon-monoxide dehydrogenase medium subunit